MTFNTTVVNNLATPVTVMPSNVVVNNGASWTGYENFMLQVPGFGTCVIQDIGSAHIPGDAPGITWGVLIVYQGMAIVGRYEGGGNIQLVLNTYGQVSLQGMSFFQVDLPALLFPFEMPAFQMTAAT
ncbi:hypothetical protein AAKU55_005344 [Oxalobacteraceae bacterium GrIS 1.11]